MVSATRAADVGLVLFALVAAAGLDALRSEERWRRWLAAASALGVGGAALFTLHHQLTHARVWIDPGLLGTVLPAALLVAVALMAFAPARIVRMVPPVLVFVVACELFVWTKPYARELIVQRGFAAERLSKCDVAGKNPFWPDNWRDVDERTNFGLFALRGLINGYDPLHLDRVRRFLASKNRS
jgi:hypothetical protein